MEFNSVLFARRSVRKYTGETISDFQLQTILQSGLLAPSSRNFHSTEFIVVTGKESLAKLSSAKAGGTMLEKASHAIVVIGNSAKSDAWIEDASIAMTQMMLTAADLGLGTCWIHCRNRDSIVGISSEEYVKKLLNIPETHSVLSILSIGVPSTIPAPHTADEIDLNKIHLDTF